MDIKKKAAIIDAIMISLEEAAKRRNSQPSHEFDKVKMPGADMFFKLAFMTDEQLKKIAKAVGL